MRFGQLIKVSAGLAVLAIALVLLTHNREIVTRLKPVLFHSEAGEPRFELGHLLETHGNVGYRLPTETAVTSAKEGDLIFEDSLWQSPRGSNFTLHFASGYELQFGENSRVVVERWNRSASNSPVLLSMLSGDFQMTHEGPPNQILVLQNGRLFTPQNKDQKRSQVLMISPKLVAAWAERAPKSVETSSMVTSEEDEHLPKLPPTHQAVSLSNEYMDEVLAGQRTKFSRCQTNALRSKGQAKGEMVIGFRISPQGRTLESRVLNSTIVDASFQACILEIVSQLRFNEFTGPDIVRSFEMKFE